jgi:polysaccharide deacetylase family protein (PEP-CTERM system associated)
MRNALSIDFEDWYRPFDARAVDGWQQYPSRIPQDTTRVLSLLERHHVRCTFFVLGEVAERFPDAVRALHRAGHEIASHGYRHVPLYQQEPGQFEREMRRSLALLEQLTGERVRGFRAPFFSIRSDTLWALESLHRLGLEYDSSVNPIPSALHGSRLGGREPFVHANGLKEYPITTYPICGVPVPFGGGVYYRLLAYRFIRGGLQRLNRRGIPANIYFHPRELDPDLPRLPCDWRLRLLVYAGTRTLEAKLQRLLQDFTFVPLREL